MAMDGPTFILQGIYAPSLLLNQTTNETLQIELRPHLAISYRATWAFTCILVLSILVYQCIKYFIADVPPLGSNLKPLPGPISTVPYLGRVHDVDRRAPWKAMKKFSDKYKGLFSLTLGGETHVWITRDEVAHDLLCNNAAISSTRNDLGAYPDVTKGYQYLPLIGCTESFHRQRKFARTMVTRGANAGFYGYITLETKRFLYELATAPDFYNLINLFCARISSRLAYGSEESAPLHVENAEKFISQLGPSGPVMNLVPFLRFLPEWIIKDKRLVRERQEQEARVWRQLFEESKKKLGGEGTPPTYVQSSLEMKEGGEKSRPLFENEDEAKFAVGMLCIVAIFTVQGPAVLFVMAMVLHPKWQERVRQEIDEVLGDDDMVDMQHNPRLPTLRAAILECTRWKSTVPLGVPRVLEKNYSYDGFFFPKGSILHVLDCAMAHDPNRYANPEVYDPSRWLDPNSPNFRAPLTEYPRLRGHHIFGRGKRMCPGQELAETELIVLCGNLLRFFDLQPKLDENGRPMWPSPDRWTSNVIGGPLPFECDIKVRDEKKARMIGTMYRDAFHVN